MRSASLEDDEEGDFVLPVVELKEEGETFEVVPDGEKVTRLLVVAPSLQPSPAPSALRLFEETWKAEVAPFPRDAGALRAKGDEEGERRCWSSG